MLMLRRGLSIHDFQLLQAKAIYVARSSSTTPVTAPSNYVIAPQRNFFGSHHSIYPVNVDRLVPLLCYFLSNVSNLWTQMIIILSTCDFSKDFWNFSSM